jgi:hypothetical protein
MIGVQGQARHVGNPGWHAEHADLLHRLVPLEFDDIAELAHVLGRRNRHPHGAGDRDLAPVNGIERAHRGTTLRELPEIVGAEPEVATQKRQRVFGLSCGPAPNGRSQQQPRDRYPRHERLWTERQRRCQLIH